jgi:hypothetical protein
MIRARLSLGLVATFLGLLASLHFLEPEFNSGHLISEYQLGSHGWIMSLAFCAFGIGAMLLAQVIAPQLSTRSGRLGLRGLWLIGAASLRGVSATSDKAGRRLRAWRVRAGGYPCFTRRVLAGEQEPGT